MSQQAKDAAKRAAAGESLGAIVTLDINRLEKSELITLGMRETLSKYILMLERRYLNWDATKPAQRHVVGMALEPLVRTMRADLDAITLELSKAALRSRAASMQEIPGVKS
jgi:hypothetical protein